jgi:hypothetical protein
MSLATMTYGQVVASLRATIAAYAQAVDDNRSDDIVATFCPDGTVDLPGVGSFTGHDALHATYSGLKSDGPTRHVVVNTHVTEWSDNHATATSDLAVFGRDEAGWAVQLVGRYYDEFHHDHGVWRFHSRKLEFVGLGQRAQLT